MTARRIEPSLDDLLGDDTGRRLMAADGVEEHRVRALMARVVAARRDFED